MRKYLYTTLLLALLAQGGAMAQDKDFSEKLKIHSPLK